MIVINSKMLLGNIFYKNNQFTEAEEIFRSLEKDRPNDFNIKVSLVVLYKLLNNKKLHLEYLKKLKNIPNKDSSNSNFIIEYLIQLKNSYIKNDKSKAIKYYNKAIKYSFEYKNLIDKTQLEEYLVVLYNQKDIISSNNYLKNELNNIFLDLILNSFLNNYCINIIKKIRDI